MFVMPRTARDAEIKQAGRAWMELMASKQFDQATEFLTRERNEKIWNIDEILSHVKQLTGGEITSPTTAKICPKYNDPKYPSLDEPQQLVVRYFEVPGEPSLRPEVAATLWTDLPIDGQWSTACATFHVRRVEDGLALEFWEIVKQEDHAEETLS